MKLFKPSRKQLLELASRFMGYSEDVIDYYCKYNNIDIGNLTLQDSTNLDILNKLEIINRYFKIKRLKDKI